MTKKEAFLEVVQDGSLSDTNAEMYLLSAGMDPDASFIGDLDEIEIAAIPCIQSLLGVGSESEGAWSQSRSKEGLKDRLLFLARKHGKEDLVNAILKVPVIKKYDWGA